MTPKEITIFHSPDSDDAFMFYGLTCGAVSEPGYVFSHDLADIETLNKRTLKGELDVTAVSVHAYAYLGGKYLIMPCGASMGGQDYGPKLVSRQALTLQSGRHYTIAIPGQYTSAALAVRLFLKARGVDAEFVNIAFDQVQHAVREGKVDCGIIIHEGQLTHEREGLQLVVDLGAWWWGETKLPLPLGVNVIRKDLGNETIRACTKVLKESIEYGLSHRPEAIAYALQYGRGITPEQADTFVGMYVNELTCDLGVNGRASIELFLEKGRAQGFIPAGVRAEFV